MLGVAFTKRTAGVDPGFYAAEAAGLRWLASAGPGAAPAVEVLDVGGDHIVLEQLSPGRPTVQTAAAFGRALHRTHRAGAAAFGSPPPGRPESGYIGRQAMAMRPTAEWGTFYAEQRVLPYARAARDRDHLSPRAAVLVERVCERLAAGAFADDEPPARLHGDLWSGNVFWTDTAAVLIDPAAHGGHPLTDLAMLDLFGTPHLPAILEAYTEAAGWDFDWQDLLGLHQLHPLLVHAVSHGPAYGNEAERVARRYAG